MIDFVSPKRRTACVLWFFLPFAAVALTFGIVGFTSSWPDWCSSAIAFILAGPAMLASVCVTNILAVKKVVTYSMFFAVIFVQYLAYSRQLYLWSRYGRMGVYWFLRFIALLHLITGLCTQALTML